MKSAPSLLEPSSPADRPLIARLGATLVHPGLPLILALLATVLCLPALWVGLQFDDYTHLAMVRGFPGRPEIKLPTLELFSFLNGDPVRTHALKDIGIAPWWMWEHTNASFWRPLSALFHVLEYRLYPDHPTLMPVLMHLHSLAWYAVVVALATVLYRRLMGAGLVAGLAALLYAVDQVHGMAVGWIANRNTLLATFFGLLTLLAFDRWRREASSRNGSPALPLALVWLTLGLLSAEAALEITGYLFAYVVCLETGPLRRRLTALLPFGALVVLWQIVYRLQGFGVMGGAGIYIDPGTEPLHFARALLERLPMLLTAEYLPLPADLFMLARGGLSWAMVGTAMLFMGTLAWASAPLLRRDPLARFWALGMVLSVLPACAATPMNRVLLLPGLGAMGLLARLAMGVVERLRSAATEAREPAGDGPYRVTEPAPAGDGPYRMTEPARASRALILLLLGYHGLVSPVMLSLGAFSPAAFGRIISCADIAPRDAAITHQDLVLVNGGDFVCASYIPIMAMNRGTPMPAHVRSLASPQADLELSRPDTHTLVLRPDRGYFGYAFEQAMWSPGHPPGRVGDKVSLTGMTVEVTEATPENRPLEATFRFDVPLEDASLRWMRWDGERLVGIEPPAVGKTLKVAAVLPAF